VREVLVPVEEGFQVQVWQLVLQLPQPPRDHGPLVGPVAKVPERNASVCDLFFATSHGLKKTEIDDYSFLVAKSSLPQLVLDLVFNQEKQHVVHVPIVTDALIVFECFNCF
jgi:hypothetical protein